MADIAATFRQPFKEQVAAFRLRLGNLVPTSRWDDLWQSQHDRAFMIAGATKADLLSDLAGAVDRAISEGTGLEAFRKDFRAIVEKHGWHGWTGEGTEKGEAWRTRVIYRTNMRTSYMAGRHAQLVEGGFKFWVYRHGGSLEPRLHHLAWDGLILPADHPFWQTHFPPNGWGCSCRVFGARTIEGAKRKGGDGAGGGGLLGSLFGGLFATGGMIYGAGSGTSDKVLIGASSGEFMVNAESTKKNRALLERINGGEVIRGFAQGGAIDGSYLRPPASAPQRSENGFTAHIDLRGNRVHQSDGGVSVSIFCIYSCEYGNDQSW
ncbi:phage head morphogenesis protein [Roseovarius sp. E0-M6]|uniref:phage head morphogenesis protein n=1 Tax=Roseovarius sp. E0-M6 TaxID=3127118 RepID=UPI003010564F